MHKLSQAAQSRAALPVPVGFKRWHSPSHARDSTKLTHPAKARNQVSDSRKDLGRCLHHCSQGHAITAVCRLLRAAAAVVGGAAGCLNNGRWSGRRHGRKDRRGCGGHHKRQQPWGRHIAGCCKLRGSSSRNRCALWLRLLCWQDRAGCWERRGRDGGHGYGRCRGCRRCC